MTDFSRICKDIALKYTDECIIMLNEKGKILHTTSDIKQICGLKKETVLQKTFPSIVRKQDKKHIKKFLTELNKKPKTKNTITVQIPTKKGSAQYYQIRAQNLLSEPDINLIILYMRNITKQKQTEQDLHKKNKEYKELLDFHQIITDNTIDVIFQVTLSGTYTFMNKASKKIAGYEPEEMIGKKWMNFVPKKELPKYLSKLKELLKGKRINDFQTFVIHKEGYLVPVEFSGSIIKKNNQTYITGVMRDLSKRMDSKRELEDLARALERQAKAKTKQLIEHQEQLQTITTFAKDAIVLMDDDGRIQFWNPAAESIFGYTKKEILGKNVHLLIASESSKDQIKKGFQQFKKTGKGSVLGKNLEIKTSTKQGSQIFIELSISAIKIRNRWHAIGIARNITERRHMQQALRKNRDRLEETVQKRTAELKESEQKYRQLFESAPVGIAIADLQGHVFDMNPTMKNISGFKASKNKEFDFQNHYVSQKDRQHIRKKLLKDEPLHNVELTLKRKNGEQYTALMDIQKIDISGKDRFLVIQRDISKLKQIQRNIAETKNYLQNIINSAKECIIAIDTSQHITLWNTAAEKLTGLSAEQVLGKPIHEFSVFESTQSFSDALKNLSKGYGYSPEEIIINSTMKTISIVQFSASPLIIQDENHQLQGILFVGHDISKDSQRRGTLLDQTSYLIMKSTSSQPIQKFISLQLSGYQGICFTRGSIPSLKKDFSPATPAIHLYDDLISRNDSSDQPLQIIKDIIQQSLSSQKKTVFFIDRIDYLFIRFSFEQVLRLIYQITPLISSHQAILLIRVNPQLLEQQQLQFLQEELFHIPTEKIEPIELDEHMYQILRFIQNLNHKNIIVSYQKVGKRFSISKVTTKKRLDELQKQGLITIRIKGRMKSVHLSEKAQLLLKQK